MSQPKEPASISEPVAPSEKATDQSGGTPKKENQKKTSEPKVKVCEEKTVDEVFVAHSVFPDPHVAFSFIPQPVSKTYAKCVVVLDTNVLLLPYRAGASSLEEIKKVLNTLKKDGRLFVPSQVAREFARNRPQKIAELQNAISDWSSRLAIPEKLTYPLLSGISEYNSVTKAISELEKSKQAYRKAVSSLLDRMREWQWKDPVSLVYKELFDIKCVCEPIIDKEATLQAMEKRYATKIPPGYKDGTKGDGGIGDYLIWLTILDIGKKHKKPLIFVTGEEKTDWQHRSGSQGILPRYELVDEYRRASDNQPFYILSLSELLKLAKAPKETVEEIRIEEAKSRELVSVQVKCPYCGSQSECMIDNSVGSSAAPDCPACKERFQIQRTSGEIIVTPIASRFLRRPPPNSGSFSEKIDAIAQRLLNEYENNRLATNSVSLSGSETNTHPAETYRCNTCGDIYCATQGRINEIGYICNNCLGHRMEDYFG